MTIEEPLAWCHIQSPIGKLVVAGCENHLHHIGFPNGSRKTEIHPDWRHDPTPFAALREQLRAYFAGELIKFDLQLRPSGTQFQQAVWQALMDIPYGETTSYGALASTIGRPKASRAVGAANGANPIPIVIPCHRVIGADRSLTGFGGGVETKAFLLELEGFSDAEPLLF